MELVYLWVEDYKNIKKQGFNFSPRFHCAYDEKSNELTIDENDDYIPDFFGENINITAIVGKNGSGKSTLLLSILEYIQNKFYSLKDKNYFFVLCDSIQVYIISSIDLDVSETVLLIPQNTISHTGSNIELTELISSVSLEAFSSDEDLENMIYFIQDKKHSKHFKDYFTPNKIIIEAKESYVDILEAISIEAKYTNIKNIRNEIDKIESFDYFKLILLNYLSSEIILISSKINFDELKNVDSLNSYQEIIEKKIYGLQEELKSIDFFDKKNRKKTFFKELKQTIDYLKKLQQKKFQQTFFENVLFKNELNKVSFNSTDYYEFEFLIDNFVMDRDFFLLEDLPKYFKLNFEDTEKKLKYSNLSSGEQSILRTRINLENRIKNSKNKNYIFLFDEPNNDLHPQWEKQFINYLTDILSQYNEYNFHLIITTHSPFLLSDIPKQNIIFLDKDKNGNCKVVDGLKEKKQTFGANIHTLLSDSFFMEDGLMGEFAKSKIDRAIKLLNQEQLNEDELKYCEQIISIIGEPIVKNQLQRMLDSKRLKKVDEIDAIKKSMIAMKQRLDELEK